MVCSVCTASQPLQVIGLDSKCPKFDFDVSATNPPWMDANEDGALSVQSKRERKHERRAERAAKHEECLQNMQDMGFCDVYGQEWVKEVLLRCDNDLEKAIAELTQYADDRVRVPDVLLD